MLDAHYRDISGGHGFRFVVEVTPHVWRKGSLSAYFRDRPQPLRLAAGEYRALIVRIGLYERFPYYVYKPFELFDVSIDDKGRTCVPDWKLRRAVSVIGMMDDDEPGVVRLPYRRPPPLEPVDLRAIRDVVEADLSRIRRRMLAAEVQPIELPRQAIWLPARWAATAQ